MATLFAWYWLSVNLLFIWFGRGFWWKLAQSFIHQIDLGNNTQLSKPILNKRKNRKESEAALDGGFTQAEQDSSLLSDPYCIILPTKTTTARQYSLRSIV
jgi:hypothetical protein